MLKNVKPNKTTFDNIMPGEWFCAVVSGHILGDAIYQRMSAEIDSNIAGAPALNAIRLEEDETNHGHSFTYKLLLVNVAKDAVVRRIGIYKIEVEFQEEKG